MLHTLYTHSKSRAVGLTFAINSILFGSWVTRIPEVKATLQLSESDLGFALLGISIGGLLMMPLTPILMHRFGTARMLTISTIAACFVPLLLLSAPSFWFFVLAAICFGMANGTMDVVMNAAAAALEQEEQVVIMSSCHGMFSLGGMLGALLGSLLVGMAVPALLHLAVVGALMLLLCFFLIPVFSQLPESDLDADGFALPTKPLLGLAFIGFCIMLGEGAVADWSSVYLKEVVHSSPFLVGLGFAGFNMTMMLGRFSGDRLISKFGARKIVSIGSLIGGLGVVLAIFASSPSLAILGFTLVGVGFSGVVPIIFRAAANVDGIPSGIGIASVTTMGILGFLLGPPLIGFISDDFGLRIGLGLVVLLSLMAALVAQRVRF